MNLTKLHIIFGLSMLMFGCTKVIEFPIPANQPQNVVNCILVADSSLGGYFYETTSIISQDTFVAAKNGRMVIKDASGSIVAFQLNNNLGKYFSNNKAKENECYNLEFSSDIGTSEAQICIPAKPVVSISDTFVIAKGLDTSYFLTIGLADQVGVNSFYRFECEVYQIVKISPKPGGGLDTLYSWKKTNFSSSNLDLFVNDYNYDNQSYLLKDDKFKDNTAFIAFNVPAIGSKKLRLQVEHITFDLFEYYRTLGAQKFVQTDPNAHYVSVYSNVKNGYGIFGGKNITQISFSRP